MLDHVDGQQFFVEGGERRAQRQPDQKQSEKKTAGAPDGNNVHARKTKMKPSAQVQKRRQESYQVKRNRKRPRFQCDLKRVA